MPPPIYCNKVNNTRSTKDQGNDNCTEKSELSNSEKCGLRSEAVGIVKSLLGPSLEDAVLRTLEFGKSLMHKEELDTEQNDKEKKYLKKPTKELAPCSNKDLNLEFLLEDRNKCTVRESDICSNEKNKKVLALAGKVETQNFQRKTGTSIRKLSHVSKIRSLDSDLKHTTTSPEKIKKQLEALIQINKDEPPEHSWNLVSAKTQKLPVEITVMPSLCVYKNEAEMNYSSSCDVQSQVSKAANECSESSRMRTTTKKRHPNKICQAPEFLSNALGPTIDVSIIDNLKMMRDIFKYDSGKGEGTMKEQLKQEIRLQNSEAEMTCRIEELQRKIEELEQKEQCLIKQIEEEEQERECRRKMFAREEQKLSEMRVCTDGNICIEQGKSPVARSMVDCLLEPSKNENLQSRISNEEEKLSRLKSQHDQYKRELQEAKCRAEALKKNKSLLDAWDIFASRVCHTRLPSFSRAYTLERKKYKEGDTSNLHCCFPSVSAPQPPKPPSRCPSRTRSRSAHSQGESKAVSSQTNIRCKMKMGEIQFPIQRDIVCGLHQMLKTCCCTNKTVKVRGHGVSSEDDLLNKCKGLNASHKYSSLESSEMKDACGDKKATRSHSDTSLKHEKCSKIVKVMWAVARINIFQNNYRTYEIMDATSTPPAKPPCKTEGIFVVKTPQKKWTTQKKNCNPCSKEFH